jgi:serine/threonine-protein kinase
MMSDWHKARQPVTGEMVGGTIVGRKYRFERPLAAGGQAKVWLARDLVLDLPVAIKLPYAGPNLLQQSQRASREARLVASLGHPSIVRVVDLAFGSDGSAYLVMEFLNGETLARRMERGRLSAEATLRLLLPILDALLLTHRRGIVHGDIKPSNVFLALEGGSIQPKLVDFGLARSGYAVPLGDPADEGVVAGTPFYVSPEQASGRGDIDHRSDVWSFCVTLYECLTQTLPFSGSTWPEVCEAILDREPASLFAAGVHDAALWRILKQGLTKSRDARWPSVLSLGRELASWLLARGISEDACGVSLETRWFRRHVVNADLSP